MQTRIEVQQMVQITVVHSQKVIISTKIEKQEKVFKGNTREMNGHVFETYYECKDETQFKNTLDMLGQYVNKYLKYPDDMEPVYTRMEEPEIKEEDIGEIANEEVRVEAIKQMAKELIERRRVAKDNLRKLFAVIWGQCSDLMQTKLQAITDFKKK